MRTCCICWRGYKTNVKNEDILIYGCIGCTKGDWQRTTKEMNPFLIKRSVDPTKDIYPYGKPLKRV